MLIAIDHGNKSVKLPRGDPFVSGLVESEVAPFGKDVLKYRGRYYQLSDHRIPYHRDKTEDERFFVLTLFAIAREINAAGRYTAGTIQVQLAVGLPPAHFGAQYQAFTSYFLGRGPVSFVYSKKPDQLHQEFIDAVFHTEPPLSAAEQRDAFETALSDALEGACSMEVAQSVHERLREQIVQHKESHDPEPLAVTAGEVGAILQSCNVPEEQVSRFLENCEEQFGKGAVLDPSNLIDSGKFEVETADARISVEPERSYLVETRMIDGRAYLLIPADGVTVNGLPIKATSVPEGSVGSAD